MRIDFFLNVKSASEAIQFYVKELNLFRVAIDYGMDAFLLRHIENETFCLSIQEQNISAMNSVLFGIAVKNCEKEFERIKKIAFSGSARIVPDYNGIIEIFDNPIGKSFMMEDPSGNQFTFFEDYCDKHRTREKQAFD